MKYWAIRTAALLIVGCAVLANAGEFVPGGPMTRGRCTVEKQAVLTDWGTRLRGTCWGMDIEKDIFPRQELRTMKLCGQNALHVYAEKNDSKPVGWAVGFIDTLVEYCRAESMYIVITFGNSHLSSYDKVYRFWEFYGPRYADMTHVIYETKNEACSATYHCADNAMKMHIDIYKYFQEIAPETHVMLMSHSNLKGGISSIYDDVERLKAADVDWTNASYAFHGYGVSAGEQVAMCKEMGEHGVAMVCTEYPSFPAADINLARAYEQAGISYFHFRACWNWELPGKICNVAKQMNLSWAPDFGDWPQPHVERPPMVDAKHRWHVVDEKGRMVTERFTLDGRPGYGVHAVYDATGRLIWNAGERRAGIPADFASQILLIKYND